MTPQNKLYEAANAVLYGWASRLTRPRSEWNEKLQALADAISNYEQEQPEAIAGEKTKEQILSEATGWVMTRIISHPGMCIMYGNEALQAMQFYASQQTSAKDKEIAELKERISELEKLI